MRSLSIVILALCLLSLSVKAQQTHRPTAKEKLEDLIFKKVEEVPEAQRFLKSSGKDPEDRHQLMIDDEPHAGFNYYVVKMGWGGSMFRTACRFCVDPKTTQVYYWDVFADDLGFSNSAIISLAKWRKLRKTALWNKPHTYKAGKLVALTN